MKDQSMCNDWGDNPDCLGKPNPIYDMDYTDVKPGEIIRWCDHCGPIWTPVAEKLLSLSADEAVKMRTAVDEAVERIEREKH